MTRHFRSLLDLSPDESGDLIERASAIKAAWSHGARPEPLKNRTVAMIFEKTSTRTRVSFETAVTHFGGNAIFLAPGDSQLGRGEPAADTAQVLSGMVDAIVLRTISQDTIDTFAEYATVPVINGLSNRYHPCQLLADMQTWVEAHGTIAGRRAAWIGDGNNMCHSWINAARLFDFHLAIATPVGYEPDPAIVAAAGSAVSIGHDPAAAATDADVVNTDTWASMGQEQEKMTRINDFSGFQVEAALLARAAPRALFLHCLPAYRGYEVSAGVIDGPQSHVWKQAHNRLHTQKALLEFLLARDSAAQ